MATIYALPSLNFTRGANVRHETGRRHSGAMSKQPAEVARQLACAETSRNLKRTLQPADEHFVQCQA